MVKAGAGGGWGARRTEFSPGRGAGGMPLLRSPVCRQLHPRGQVRADAGRDPEPTAVIDSQSVRGAGTVPRAGKPAPQPGRADQSSGTP
jgi:hypothetical protein